MKHEDYKKNALLTDSDAEHYEKIKERISTSFCNEYISIFINNSDTIEKLKKNVIYGKDPEVLKSNYRVENSDFTAREMHAILGMIGELGEIILAIKERNKDDLVKELGDFEWYKNLLMNEHNIDQEEVWQKNIDKLRKRYGDKFSEEKAIERKDVND